MNPGAADGPTFLGIGAQKSGTTWLYKMLAAHPGIGMLPGKEAHFWDHRWPAGVSMADYVAQFAALEAPVKGEITPAYGILPGSTIAVLRAHFPALRLVYLMRNPVERAWSQARMELAMLRHKGREVAPGAVPQWLIAHLASRKSVERGDYAACLDRWLALYPREQMKTFVYEEFFAAPRSGLQACCRHLGADPDFYDAVSDQVLATVVVPERELLALEPEALPARCPPEYREALMARYAPMVRRLEDRLGRDLSALWGLT